MSLYKGFLHATIQTHCELQVRWNGYVQLSHLISHVRQILEAHGRTEHLVVHVHDLVLVTARVQVIHSGLYQVQSFMARSLQVVFCREISPKRARQASMIAKVTALEKKRGQKRKTFQRTGKALPCTPAHFSSMVTSSKHIHFSSVSLVKI